MVRMLIQSHYFFRLFSGSVLQTSAVKTGQRSVKKGQREPPAAKVKQPEPATAKAKPAKKSHSGDVALAQAFSNRVQAFDMEDGSDEDDSNDDFPGDSDGSDMPDRLDGEDEDDEDASDNRPAQKSAKRLHSSEPSSISHAVASKSSSRPPTDISMLTRPLASSALKALPAQKAQPLFEESDEDSKEVAQKGFQEKRRGPKAVAARVVVLPTTHHKDEEDDVESVDDDVGGDADADDDEENDSDSDDESSLGDGADDEPFVGGDIEAAATRLEVSTKRVQRESAAELKSQVAAQEVFALPTFAELEAERAGPPNLPSLKRRIEAVAGILLGQSFLDDFICMHPR